jgi:hypothetical protein
MRRCVRCWEKYGSLQTYGLWIFNPYPIMLESYPGALLTAALLRDVLLGAVVEQAAGDWSARLAMARWMQKRSDQSYMATRPKGANQCQTSHPHPTINAAP